jgi:hypothetical protein
MPEASRRYRHRAGRGGGAGSPDQYNEPALKRKTEARFEGPPGYLKIATSVFLQLEMLREGGPSMRRSFSASARNLAVMALVSMVVNFLQSSWDNLGGAYMCIGISVNRSDNCVQIMLIYPMIVEWLFDCMIQR